MFSLDVIFRTNVKLGSPMLFTHTRDIVLNQLKKADVVNMVYQILPTLFPGVLLHRQSYIFMYTLFINICTTKKKLSSCPPPKLRCFLLRLCAFRRFSRCLFLFLFLCFSTNRTCKYGLNIFILN